MVAIYGTVEMGGTKTSCAVGSSPDDLSQEVTVPTTDPSETLGRVIEHLSSRSAEAVGIASFGPLELRPGHPEYGHIRSTPKKGWTGIDVVGPFQAALGVPIGLDTDVNGAALGEGEWGAGRGLGSFVYVTVGTGIGGGAIVEGRPIHGLGHPEMGHITVRRHPDDEFRGACPAHGDCLEGLANGPAVERRHGTRGEELTGDEQGMAVEIEAFYLAQLARNLVYTLAPERIILGGGVSLMPGLVERVGARLTAELAGYPGLAEHEQGFVVPPGLGHLSGLAGGLILADVAFKSSG
ncbi:MAG TPA: ROK family protein [Acidimicrobiia bacterium]|nr:ROK family protein [Acidimicrobiia bacterium]